MASDLEQRVETHYARSDLERTILEALVASGKDPGRLAPADLAPVDEFHTGGRQATIEFAAQIDLAPDMHLLDIGCGIGGPSRYFAETHGCRVTGIDLTEDYVRTAAALARRVGLAGRVSYRPASALALPFEPETFDGAYMMHVGMNIGDKPALFAEVARVLRPGGRFVVYDLMRIGDAALPWPMPWADDAATSFVETPARYRELLEAADFRVEAERDWSDLVLEASARMRERLAAEGIPVVGLHLLMGPDAMSRLRKVGECVRGRALAPVQLTAALPA
jgi:ubiquinone/menaquinone biosynthesis C-methylase UbiE